MISPNTVASLVTKSNDRIEAHVEKTPLLFDEHYRLWLKCENLQLTGSFKFRGALSKLTTLPKGSTIVTASTGNHGLGVCRAAQITGHNVIVFLPSGASPQKMAKLKSSGARLELVQGDSLAAELAGINYAQTNQLDYVSPYNDPDVIAGQGTIGIEIAGELPKVDRVYITVGGGGLISGIASYIKHDHAVEIIGCQPENSPEMYLSVKAGHVVQAPDARPTLSDGSAGPLEEDSITFPLCSTLIDRFELVSEYEIEKAIRYLYQRFHLTVEGAAGVAMAVAMRDGPATGEAVHVVVLCGGNIDPAVHQSICGY